MCTNLLKIRFVRFDVYCQSIKFIDYDLDLATEKKVRATYYVLCNIMFLSVIINASSKIVSLRGVEFNTVI